MGAPRRLAWFSSAFPVALIVIAMTPGSALALDYTLPEFPQQPTSTAECDALYQQYQQIFYQLQNETTPLLQRALQVAGSQGTAAAAPIYQQVDSLQEQAKSVTEQGASARDQCYAIVRNVQSGQQELQQERQAQAAARQEMIARDTAARNQMEDAGAARDRALAQLYNRQQAAAQARAAASAAQTRSTMSALLGAFSNPRTVSDDTSEDDAADDAADAAEEQARMMQAEQARQQAQRAAEQARQAALTAKAENDASYDCLISGGSAVQEFGTTWACGVTSSVIGSAASPGGSQVTNSVVQGVASAGNQAAFAVGTEHADGLGAPAQSAWIDRSATIGSTVLSSVNPFAGTVGGVALSTGAMVAKQVQAAGQAAADQASQITVSNVAASSTTATASTPYLPPPVAPIAVSAADESGGAPAATAPTASDDNPFDNPFDEPQPEASHPGPN